MFPVTSNQSYYDSTTLVDAKCARRCNPGEGGFRESTSADDEGLESLRVTFHRQHIIPEDVTGSWIIGC